jgi:hypothetical protein
VSSSSRLLRASLKEARTTTLKFLIPCALIAAMSETAMAQTTIPEKCQNLHVTNYTSETDRAGNPTFYAFIQNDSLYNLINATFYFDLLSGENFKVGQGWASIQRLLHGDAEKKPINYSTDLDIKDISISIRLVSITCNFSST